MKFLKFIKFIFLLLVVFIVFILVGSTVPCVLTKNMTQASRDKLDKINYYSDTEGPDRACVIETPTDALNVRIDIIKSAKSNLDITYYKITDSKSSRAFLSEVVEAADRGVNIRLLLDGKISFMNGTESNNIIKSLNSHPNISCKLYNKIKPLHPWNLHMLLHDKFIIADGRMLLLGGRNIDERHFGPAEFKKPITNDRDVFIYKSNDDINTSSVIEQVTDYMDSLWNYEYTTAIKNDNFENAKTYFKAFKDSKAEFQKTNPKFYKKTIEDYKAATVPTSKITLLHNPIENEKKEPWVGYSLRNLALGAKNSVVVQTPYSTGNKDLLSAMKSVAEKSKLTITTNSAASTPNLPAFSNYLGQRQKFIDTGAKIYEYQNRDSIHGKSLIIDNRLSAVGSFNLDDRSMYLDTETMLMIDSPEFSAQLLGVMQNIVDQSLEVGPDNEYIKSQSVEPMEVSTSKKFALKLVYYIVKPFQSLL